MTIESVAERRREFWDDPAIERAEGVLWKWADELAERLVGGSRIKAHALLQGPMGGGGGGSAVPLSFEYELVEAVIRKCGGEHCRALLAHVYDPNRSDSDGGYRQKGSHHAFEHPHLDAMLRSLGATPQARIRLLEGVEKRILREIARRQGAMRR